MENQWESKELHEHPAKHQAGTYGKVGLSKAGVYYFQVGSSHMSCPQDWAAKIHAEERQTCSAGGCSRPAKFQCVDSLRPTLERKGFLACARHGLLWHRQGRGSIWVFPLEPEEAQSLTEEAILKIVEASGEAPLPRK